MLAADTNILVRLLTGDDPRQFLVAQQLFRKGPVWIGKTVLLETAWVLRSLYGFAEAEIVTALAGLCALENVETEDHRAVLRALDLARKGLALDDSLHLCSAPPDAVFTSFDSKLVKRVRRAGVTRVEAV